MEEGLDIELHPGITEDELDEPTTSDDSDMEMPSLLVVEDDDSGAHTHCNCHRKCDAMDLENICGLCLPSAAKHSETDLIESVFQAVKAVVHAKENEGQKSIVWRLGDTVVCNPFWCFVNNTSHDTVDDIQNLIATGHQTMPAQLPKTADAPDIAQTLDNTPKEAKNQSFLSFLAYLRTSGKFDSVEVEYMETGHTHNEQDQHFSTASSNISLAPVLEGPEEFRNHMRKTLQDLCSL